MNPVSHDRHGDISRELTALIGSAPVCTRCLAFRVGRTRVDVYQLLQQIAEATRLHTDVGRCERCLHDTVVHQIARVSSQNGG